jgi:hypothetical protein
MNAKLFGTRTNLTAPAASARSDDEMRTGFGDVASIALARIESTESMKAGFPERCVGGMAGSTPLATRPRARFVASEAAHMAGGGTRAS